MTRRLTKRTGDGKWQCRSPSQGTGSPAALSRPEQKARSRRDRVRVARSDPGPLSSSHHGINAASTIAAVRPEPTLSLRVHHQAYSYVRVFDEGNQSSLWRSNDPRDPRSEQRRPRGLSARLLATLASSLRDCGCLTYIRTPHRLIILSSSAHRHSAHRSRSGEQRRSRLGERAGASRRPAASAAKAFCRCTGGQTWANLDCLLGSAPRAPVSFFSLGIVASIAMRDGCRLDEARSR